MKLKNKFSISKMISLLTFVSALSVLVACTQIKKGINSMSEDKKITKIEIGETYKATWSKIADEKIENDKVLYYIKFLDEKTFMYVEDDTQHSEEYYSEEHDDIKLISIKLGTYKKSGDNFVQESYLAYDDLVFSPLIDVKKGAIGEVSSFMKKHKEFFEEDMIYKYVIEKYDDYYRIDGNKPKTSKPSDALRISDVKLPDTVEEFLAQYNLTSEDNKKSSDVKPQSYGQSEKKKMFDPAQFPVHREDDGTIWVGF
jgi:hypothetical protein